MLGRSCGDRRAANARQRTNWENLIGAGFKPAPICIAAYAQPRGPRPLRQGGFETRPYINPDPYVQPAYLNVVGGYLLEMGWKAVRRRHCHETVPPSGSPLSSPSIRGRTRRRTRDCCLHIRPPPSWPRRLDDIARNVSMSVLRSPVSKSLRPHCAAAPTPGTALALGPARRARSALPL